MSEAKKFSTSEFMKKFKINRNALRLYEDMGLFSKVSRSDSGYRQYSDRDVEDLNFILKAKEVGFTLNEIKELLVINRNDHFLTCGTISSEIKSKVEEIDHEVKLLTAKKRFLNTFLTACEEKDKSNICKVVENGFNKKSCC